MSTLAIRKLSHISLNVNNLETSLEFYERVMGFELLFRDELPAGMGQAAGMHIAGAVSIELLQLAGPDGTSNTVDTSQQCTRIVLSVADITAAKSALESSGVSNISEMELDGISMLFFQDPDKRTIELSEFPSHAFSLSEYRAER